MRFLKTLGLLLIVAAVCRLALFLVVGPAFAGSGNRYGSEVAGALLIYMVAGVGAGIAALITRERDDDFPGLQTGLLTALIFTATQMYSLLSFYRCSRAAVRRERRLRDMRRGSTDKEVWGRTIWSRAC